ncbi:hypothetical protein ABW253_000650 [Campylobacter upsaliensis]
MKWAFNGKFYNLRSIYSTTGIEKESKFINLSIKRKNELDVKFEEFKNKLKDLQQTFF